MAVHSVRRDDRWLARSIFEESRGPSSSETTPRNSSYCNSTAMSGLRLCRMTHLPGLLSYFFLEQIPQLSARLVQLRLRVTYRTTHNPGNLVVFVTLHIVQNEHSAISGRQFVDRALQIDPINRSTQLQVRSTDIFPRAAGVFVGLRGLF